MLVEGLKKYECLLYHSLVTYLTLMSIKIYAHTFFHLHGDAAVYQKTTG